MPSIFLGGQQSLIPAFSLILPLSFSYPSFSFSLSFFFLIITLSLFPLYLNNHFKNKDFNYILYQNRLLQTKFRSDLKPFHFSITLDGSDAWDLDTWDFWSLTQRKRRGQLLYMMTATLLEYGHIEYVDQDSS
ncbi:hypothetical protein RCL_jg17009.t1 [Rhizophagus clarus]|uniref:Uncharacterized protein n=1 Tax=Rhizophagus clarus TaxID=94130 RepID=A0A8H3QTY5_9GLOM|nr:hypothetical protein RCL_jg17009.t1 [Rhizophagus clarus]